MSWVLLNTSKCLSLRGFICCVQDKPLPGPRIPDIPLEVPTLETRGELAMSYADKTLNCRDCGEPFVFTAGEQEFYAQKGFTNEPTRCLPCRQSRKSQMNGRGDSMGGGYRDRSASSGPREQYATVCAGCGKEATVPFVPRNNKPVYCDDCFQNQRRGSRA